MSLLSETPFNYCESPGWRWAWLGRLEYQEAMRRQRLLVAERKAGLIPDTWLFLEHEPVFTLGKKAQLEEVLWSAETCQQRGVQVVRSDRGGQCTYHGPGQLVGYAIVDIRKLKLKIPEFVRALEEIMCETLRAHGVEAEIKPMLPGVWVRGKKIAALGLHFSRGISSHGFAVNIAPDLGYFLGIMACGAKAAVTSLQEQAFAVPELSVLARQFAIPIGKRFY